VEITLRAMGGREVGEFAGVVNPAEWEREISEPPRTPKPAAPNTSRRCSAKCGLISTVGEVAEVWVLSGTMHLTGERD